MSEEKKIIKDEIVKIKTAKLAKEKGFVEPCKKYYVEYLITNESDNPSFRTKKGEIELSTDFIINNSHSDLSNENYICYAAPSQSLLQRWLREKYNIHVEPYISRILFGYIIKAMDNHPIYPSIQETDKICGFQTYEDALENGLYEALIKI
jgi:hypothetical protein